MIALKSLDETASALLMYMCILFLSSAWSLSPSLLLPGSQSLLGTEHLTLLLLWNAPKHSYWDRLALQNNLCRSEEKGMRKGRGEKEGGKRGGRREENRNRRGKEEGRGEEGAKGEHE